MNDRSVRVRLEATVTQFVADVGVSATRAVDRLGDAADKTERKLQKLGHVAVGAAINAQAGVGVAGLKKLGDQAEKTGEEIGDRTGKGVRKGMAKWLLGSGGGPFAELGKSGGTVFGSGFLGALKTPIIGPALVATLTAAVLTAAPAAGAVGGAAFVTGFGAGLAGLGIAFAAQNEDVKTMWSDTLKQLGSDMRLISEPFEFTLIRIARYFERTVDTFNPVLQKAFKPLSAAVDDFANHAALALEQLVPAVEPISRAFSNVLRELGQGGALKAAFADISAGLTDLANSVAANPEALADFTRGVGEVVHTATDLVRVLNEANNAFSELTGGTSLVDVTMRGLQATMAPLIGLFTGLEKSIAVVNALTHSTDASGSSMSAAAAGTVALAQAYQKTGAAAKGVADPAEAAAAAVERTKERAREAREVFERFISTTFRLQNQLLSLSGSQISFQAAIDAASASIKENGRTLDINTEKGRANRTALNEVARAANEQTEAMIRTNGDTAAAAASAERSRANFVQLALQMGVKNKAAAEAMARSLIAIPNVSRTAKLNANISDLESKLATAKTKLKDPKLTATQRAKLEADIRNLQAGIAAAKAALASVPASKTTTITSRFITERITRNQTTTVTGGHAINADGGFYPTGMFSFADGGSLPSQATIAAGRGRGLVQWAEGETGGEAFIPLAPSKRARSEEILSQVASTFGLQLVRSFASGGFLPGGRLVDIAQILQQLGVPFNPVAGVNYTATLAAANRANRAAVPYRTAAFSADAREQAAKADVARLARSITLQQRYITSLRQQGASETKIRREQRELIVLQDQLYRGKQRVTAATKASVAADAAYKVKLDAASKANEAHKASIEKLVEQQRAAVEMAQQVSDSLQQGANIGDLFGKSLTGKGLLADLQGKGTELAQFGTLITALRKQGLTETLIQQIVGKGAGQGTGVAQAILGGGLALINALNKAQWALEKQADLIGAGSAAAQYGVPVARATGGPAWAGQTYRVNEKGQEYFTAPISGYISPAGDPNRYIRSMAWGGGSGSVSKEVHVHQTLQFYGVSMAEADLIAQRANAKAELMNRGY